MNAPTAPDHARSVWSPRLFWGFQTGFWLMGALFLTVLLTAFELGDNMSNIIAGRVIIGVLLTTMLHYFYQTPFMRTQPRSRKWLIVIILAVGLSFAASITWIQLIREMGLGVMLSESPFYSITTRLISLLVWNLAYFGVDLLQTSHAIKLDAAQAKLAARAGELKQLQDQLNPHFLFNALNIVKASTVDPRVAAEAIQTLADYLRFCLRESRPLEPLSRELDSLELYLSLQYIRFQDDLDCRMDATPEAMNAMVPPMLVQPLLENAFKYGARTSAMPLRIHVRATIVEDWLTISVTNSGSWVPPSVGTDGVPVGADTGTGLANLRRRLALLLGERATVQIDEVDTTVTVTLRLPVSPTALAPLQATRDDNLQNGPFRHG